MEGLTWTGEEAARVRDHDPAERESDHLKERALCVLQIMPRVRRPSNDRCHAQHPVAPPAHCDGALASVNGNCSSSLNRAKNGPARQEEHGPHSMKLLVNGNFVAPVASGISGAKSSSTRTQGLANVVPPPLGLLQRVRPQR
jgi:hypothetical protein